MNNSMDILEETEVSFAPELVFGTISEINNQREQELNPEILTEEYPPEISETYKTLSSIVVGYRGPMSKLRDEIDALVPADGINYRNEFVGFISPNEMDPTIQIMVVGGILDVTNNVNIAVSFRAEINPRNERMITAHRNSEEVAMAVQVAQTVVTALNFRTENFALTEPGKEWLTMILNYFARNVPNRWEYIRREIRAGIPLIYVAKRWGVGNYALSEQHGDEFVQFAQIVEQVRSGK